MLILIRILFATYIVAINFYAFLTLKSQKDAFEEGDRCAIRDTRLYLSAIMGGAITIFVFMLIFKFRLSNILLMVTLPIIAVVNVYLSVLIFQFDFGFGYNQVAQNLLNINYLFK